MRFLLDSCICIYYINGKKPKVRQNLHQHAEQDMFVSAITKGEMFAGSLGSRTPQRSRQKQERFFSRFRSLPFDDRRGGAVRKHIRSFEEERLTY